MKEDKLNWRDIPISKEINPREVLDKQSYGSNSGKFWKLRKNPAKAISMFNFDKR